MQETIRSQLRRHSVAIISLVVALVSLSYNTWRNEVTEHNRNIRFAGFELILKLGELQQTVFYRHYDRDPERGNPRTGWTAVLVMGDLAKLMPEPVPHKVQVLHKAWQEHWSTLGKDEAGAQQINQAIDDVRKAVQVALADLD